MPAKKLTEQEKLARKAAKITAKDKAAAGLFADYVEETTAAHVYWKGRFDKAARFNWYNPAGAAETGMEWVRLHAIERLAVTLLGAAVAGEVIAYVRRTYPMPDYGLFVWSELLTGLKSVTLRMRAEPNPTPETPHRVRMVVEHAFPPAGWAPPLTRDQFWALFPYKEPALGPDDPTGLFDRTIGDLKRRAA